MATSERVLSMKRGFMQQHEDGKTISEIAEHFGVSIWSVYNNLQEIADANGVTRESLLVRVHKPHEILKIREAREKEKINPEKLLEKFEEIDKNLIGVIEDINNILEKEQEEEDGRNY